MNYLFILLTKMNFVSETSPFKNNNRHICPLPDGRHLAVGCLTRLAQVGAARGHLRAKPCLPQLNLQYKSRLIHLSKEWGKFEQTLFEQAAVQMDNITDPGSLKPDPDFLVNQDPDTDPGFTTTHWEKRISHTHKKNIFSRRSKLHETPPALKTKQPAL
jgi:hypothetical protein